MANAELLDSTLKVITEIENGYTDRGPRWDQGTWRKFQANVVPQADDHRCQTAMCFAGWVADLDPKVAWLWPAAEVAKLDHDGRYAIIDEMSLVVIPEEMITEELKAEPSMVCWDSTHATKVRETGALIVEASAYAAWALDISEYEADLLFEAHNGLDDLESLINKIKAGTLEETEENAEW